MVELRGVPFPMHFEHDRLRSTTVYEWLRLRFVEKGEFSEVARWRSNDPRGFVRTTLYRSFDGSLWTPSRHGRNDPSAEQRIAEFHRAIDRRNDWLVKNAGGVPKIFSSHDMPTEAVAHELPWELQEMALKEADRLERKHIFLDGELHERSYGPLLGTMWKGGSSIPKFQMSEGRSITRVVQRSALCFDGLRIDPAVELIECHLGRISLERPRDLEVVGEWEGETVLAPLAAEFAVWHFLWEAGRLPTPWPRPIVETTVEARRALGARWRGLEIDLHPKYHKTAGEHLHGRDAPPPHDLVALIGRIGDVSEGRLDPQSVACWRMVEERTHRFVSSRPMPHAAELDHFVI